MVGLDWRKMKYRRYFTSRIKLLLGHFFIKARRRLVEEMVESMSQTHLLQFIEVYLSKNYSLLTDIDFEKSHQTLKAACKKITVTAR